MQHAAGKIWARWPQGRQRWGSLEKTCLQVGLSLSQPLIAEAMRQVYDPLVAWARTVLGAEFAVSSSIFGTQQPDSAVNSVRTHLKGAVLARGSLLTNPARLVA